MGDYADMMLDGTLCECCGALIDLQGGEGLPRYCSPQCARDRGADLLIATRRERHAARHGIRVNCPQCKRRVKKTGLADHIRALHPSPAIGSLRPVDTSASHPHQPDSAAEGAAGNGVRAR